MEQTTRWLDADALQVFRTRSGEYHLIDPQTGLDAYGDYTVDGDEPWGALTHAPTPEGMDHISAIIDRIPDFLFGRMLSVARSE